MTGRRLALAASAVPALAAAAWLVIRSPARPGPSPSPPPAPAVHRSLAILGFEDLGGHPESAWISTALSEMLGAELSATEAAAPGAALSVVYGEDVARMRLELSLPATGALKPDALVRVRTYLGAEYVVLGAYRHEPAGDQLQLDVILQETVGGDVALSASEHGAATELSAMASRIGRRLREALGVGAPTTAEAQALVAGLPRTPEAGRLHAEGLDRLRQFDTLAARDLLQKAVASDPSFALAHTALSQAWATLGYDSRARDSAKLAFELATPLSRRHRLLVEGNYREVNKEWDQAVSIYTSLAGFFTDNLDYKLRLAAAQISARRGKDALATIEAMRALPAPAAQDPRIDLAEAMATYALSDYPRSRQAAQGAAEKGMARGARLLVARARFHQGWACYRLGDLAAARAAAEEARGLFAGVGDKAGEARALHQAASILADQGELARARAGFEEALTIERGTGTRLGVAIGLNSVGRILVQEGELSAARQRFEEALAIARAAGDPRGVGITLYEIAAARRLQGALAEAEAAYREGLKLHREGDDRLYEARGLSGLAALAAARGEQAGAEKLAAEALAIQRAIGDKRGVADTLAVQGDLRRDAGDVEGARRAYQEALDLRRELAAGPEAALALLALARASLEEGRASEGETAAVEAAAALAARPDDAALAQTVVARCRLARGALPEARTALAAAEARAGKTEAAALRVCTMMAGAELSAAEGHGDEARKRLDAARAEARRTGLQALLREAARTESRLARR